MNARTRRLNIDPSYLSAMNLEAGTFIKNTSLLDDTVFQNTVIFIAEHNAEGALGFIINRPFGRALNELEEFRHSPYFPLHEGGPVDSEHLYFLHRRPELVTEGKPVMDDICLGGNFKQAVIHINNKTLSSKDIKIFVGYCGWDAGELEAEIEEGSWIFTSGDGDLVFS